ncbi:hypothetical protein GF325_19150 [Candidatus Bathyarchaeota archaeon]|nr:hypothetical protein [Candidatus Bathyarchaeota archaeon]
MEAKEQEVTGKRVTPERKNMLRIAYMSAQVISSILVILSSLLGFLDMGKGISALFTVNSVLFILVFLGTNFLTLVTKGAKLPVEQFIFLESCIGIGVTITIGHCLIFTKLAFFSEMAIFLLGSVNLFILMINRENEFSLSIEFHSMPRMLIILLAVYMLISLLCFDAGTLYNDDVFYYEGAVNFIENVPNLAKSVITGPFGEVELSYPWGFPILLGMALKGGMTTSTIALKLMVIITNTLVLLPTYSYMKIFFKDEKLVYMLVMIITFNQWAIIENSYLLPDNMHKLFLTTSLFCFTIALKKNRDNSYYSTHLAIALGIFLGTVNYYVKPNGTLQIIAPFLLILGIMVINAVHDSNWNAWPWSFFRKIKGIRVKGIKKLFLFQCGLMILFAVPFLIDYWLRNGITVSDFALHGLPYSLYREGHEGQFTHTGGFSIPWLWERFAYNFSFLARNFTMLTGWFHDLTFSSNKMRFWTNLTLSLVIIGLISIGIVYNWIKQARKNFLLFMYTFIFFGAIFASLLLWGETYFMIQRNLSPLLVLIMPSFAIFLNDLSKYMNKKGKSNNMRINAPTITKYAFLPILVLSLYGTVGWFIPLMFRSIPIETFTGWQFYGEIVII